MQILNRNWLLIKQRFRKTCVECLDDIVNVVELSAPVNHAQLVGTHNGHVIVPTYNWVTFFATHLKKISLNTTILLLLPTKTE